MIYEKHKQNTAITIGIVIVNDTEKNHDVKFLGYDNKRPPEGVYIYNSCADTLYDDNRLGELRNWINSVGAIEVTMMRLNTTSPVQLRNVFNISHTDIKGQICSIPLITQNFINNQSFNQSVIDIPYRIRLDSWTSFEYVINRFSSIQLTFFPSSNQLNKLRSSFSNLYESIKDEYQAFDKDKRKKFLFIS